MGSGQGLLMNTSNGPLCVCRSGCFSSACNENEQLLSSYFLKWRWLLLVLLFFNGGILQGLPSVSRKKEGGDAFTSSQGSTIISKQITPKASVSYFFCISDPYLQLVCLVVTLNAPPALQKSTFLKMNSSAFPGGCQWSHTVRPPTLTPNPVHQILSFPSLSSFSPFPHYHGFHSASQPVGILPVYWLSLPSWVSSTVSFHPNQGFKQARPILHSHAIWYFLSGWQD